MGLKTKGIVIRDSPEKKTRKKGKKEVRIGSHMQHKEIEIQFIPWKKTEKREKRCKDRFTHATQRHRNTVHSRSKVFQGRCLNLSLDGNVPIVVV